MTKIPIFEGDRTIIGHHTCVYDAWNRLVKVQTDATTPADIAVMAYDGLGRRIKKTITISGDWNCTYHFYYNGYRMIETRNGSNLVLKQHVWGRLYVDELVQIGLNDDPSDQSEGTGSQCLVETYYYAAHDANFNVTNLFESDGDLKERYAYTPYGRRQVYKPVDVNDTFGTEAIPHSQPHGACPDLIGSLCDIGHQGLLHDKEFGLIYNRARYLHPLLGRFLQRDPLGYVDGMNVYEYVAGNPLLQRDPTGLEWWSEDGTLGAFGGGFSESNRYWQQGLVSSGSNPRVGHSLKWKVQRAIHKLHEAHRGYNYYEKNLTGLRSLLWDKLWPMIGKMDTFAYWTREEFVEEGVGGATAAFISRWWGKWLLVFREGRAIDSYDVFHELIHAYEMHLGKLKAPKRPIDEQITHGAVRLLRSHDSLREMESLLVATKLDPDSVNSKWVFSVTAHRNRRVNKQSVSRIEQDLGLSIHCNRLAAFYNRWPPAVKACIKFHCDIIPWRRPVSKGADGFYHLGPAGRTDDEADLYRIPDFMR